jgi:hypothetical protein
MMKDRFVEEMEKKEIKEGNEIVEEKEREKRKKKGKGGVLREEGVRVRVKDRE